MRFLVYLYYTQPFCRTSTFGQNHAYCIRIFVEIMEVHSVTYLYCFNEHSQQYHAVLVKHLHQMSR